MLVRKLERKTSETVLFSGTAEHGDCPYFSNDLVTFLQKNGVNVEVKANQNNRDTENGVDGWQVEFTLVK